MNDLIKFMFCGKSTDYVDSIEFIKSTVKVITTTNSTGVLHRAFADAENSAAEKLSFATITAEHQW